MKGIQKLVDRMVEKALNETLEERSSRLLSKIKSKVEEDTTTEGEWTEVDLDEKEEICSECGSMMREGECSECGSKYEAMENKMADLGGEFDYVETNEKLYGGQKKLDKNKNGKLDSEDFKMLRKPKKSHTEESWEDSDYLTDIEEEVEEGNKFTGALMKAKEDGKTSFDLDGKTYHIKEAKEKKFIQKAVKKMEKKGTEGSFKKYCGGEVTMDCINKAMKSKDPDLVKKANFAKNIKAYKGSKHESIKESIQLTEDELIDVIEMIVKEQKVESNIRKTTKPKGLSTYEKAHKGSGSENEDYIKSVTKKMKEYLKDGSMGDYSMDPKIFPAGNGELKKMKKMAYVPSTEVQEYTDNLTAAGQENLVYDEIHPNEDWVTDNIEGSSRTGNNPEWANSVETPTNKKRNKVRKDNLLGAIKAQAYNKAPQPIVSDETGSGKKTSHFGVKSNKKVNDLMTKLESTENKNDKLIKEEFEKIQKLISYNKKTQ